MAFPSSTSTCILQQQAPQPDFPYQHASSTHSSAHFRHPGPQSSLGPSQAAQPHVQTLQRQLDGALRRIREHEETILHLATISRQSLQSLRTSHGFICPDCKQEVPHTCSSHSVITSSSIQLPLNPVSASFKSSTSHNFELPPCTSNAFTDQSTNPFTYPSAVASLSNSTGLQNHVTVPISQGDLFSEHVAARTTFKPPTVPGFYAPTSLPAVSCPVTTPSHPHLSFPGPSIAIPSASNDLWLGKRGICPTDLEFGPDRKRARQSLPEETRIASQQSDLRPSQYPKTSSLIPSFNETTHPAPEVLSTAAEDDDVASEQEIRAEWSVRYNNEVQRVLDVALIRSWDVGTVSGTYCLKFSKDGKYLAVGLGENGATSIYDVRTGLKTCTLRDINANKYNSVICLAFSPNGLYLANSLGDSICIWEISKKHVRNVIEPSLGTFVGQIDFSPDGRLIASCTHDNGSLEIWNWRDRSRKFLKPIEPDIGAIKFSPDGKCILVGLSDGDIQIWNVCTGQLVGKLTGHGRYVGSIAFTPDGMGLVGGGEDHTVRFWDISSFRSWDNSVGRRVRGDNSIGREVWSFKEHESYVGFVAVSSNSRWVVSSSHGKVSVWNAHNTELHCELHCELKSLYDFITSRFDYSPVNGCLVAALYEDSRVFLWRLNGVLD